MFSSKALKAARRVWEGLTSERSARIIEMGAAISTIAVNLNKMRNEKGQPGPVGGPKKPKNEKK